MLATLLIVLKHILCFLLLAIFEINGLCYLACTRLFLEGGEGAFPIGLTGSSYSYMLSRLLQINNILLLPASYYIHTCMYEWDAISMPSSKKSRSSPKRPRIYKTADIHIENKVQVSIWKGIQVVCHST